MSGRPARTLEEAAAAVPDGVAIRLSLPVSAVLMERMTLPSVDREELGGMVTLQLEKSLPYGGDEVTSAFEIIRQEQNESDLLAIAVSNEQLDGLCQPLRTRRKLPIAVSIYALQLAAKFPGEEVLALIFREADSTILGIAEKGKLVAAHATEATIRDEFLDELPRLLLTAELEGAPVNFTRVAVEQGLAGWIDGLQHHFGSTPVLLVPVDGPLDQGQINLVPAQWTAEKARLAQNARVREWLMLAGAVYLFLLLAAAGYIIWLQRQVASFDAEVRANAPAVEDIGNQKARWLALQAAVDPTRYTVELLQQVNKCIPSPDLHVTVFDQSPTQFMVEGEAPTASVALQYLDALRNNADLKDFRFESGPPEILPNERAHFRIFGKL
jgi:hypothetical protein